MILRKTFEITIWTMGILLLVQRFINRLHLDSLIEQHVPTRDSRYFLTHSSVFGVLLCNLIGRTDFMYIADCKLCSKKSMVHIALNHWTFTIMFLRISNEHCLFRAHTQDNDLPCEKIMRRPNPWGRDRTKDVWRVVESPFPSVEGYRIIWLISMLKAKQDHRIRLATLQKTLDVLDALNSTLQEKRCRIQKQAVDSDAVQKIFNNVDAERWADVMMAEHKETSFKKEEPSCPGPNTGYIRSERLRFAFVWKPKAEAIAYDAQ